MPQDKPRDTAVFAEGISFYRPRDGAPEYVKGNITIDVEKFATFLDKHVSEGKVRLDLKTSKKTGEDGKPKLYLQLNTWKKTEVKKEHGELDPKDMPF